jgi:transcriptional regulator with XRE-family HTH domain
MALAATLRRLREEKGETQGALAYKAGIATGSLARLELGQSSPGWGTVLQIAAALGVSLPELVDAVEAER